MKKIISLFLTLFICVNIPANGTTEQKAQYKQDILTESILDPSINVSEKLYSTDEDKAQYEEKMYKQKNLEKRIEDVRKNLRRDKNMTNFELYMNRDKIERLANGTSKKEEFIKADGSKVTQLYSYNEPTLKEYNDNKAFEEKIKLKNIVKDKRRAAEIRKYNQKEFYILIKYPNDEKKQIEYEREEVSKGIRDKYNIPLKYKDPKRQSLYEERMLTQAHKRDRRAIKKRERQKENSIKEQKAIKIVTENRIRKERIEDNSALSSDFKKAMIGSTGFNRGSKLKIGSYEFGRELRIIAKKKLHNQYNRNPNKAQIDYEVIRMKNREAGLHSNMKRRRVRTRSKTKKYR